MIAIKSMNTSADSARGLLPTSEPSSISRIKRGRRDSLRHELEGGLGSWALALKRVGAISTRLSLFLHKGFAERRIHLHGGWGV